MQAAAGSEQACEVFAREAESLEPLTCRMMQLPDFEIHVIAHLFQATGEWAIFRVRLRKRPQNAVD